MESPYATCTIGPNQNTDFPYSQPFRSYGPIWVPALFLSFHIEGLGFEPRTLGFEAQVATTLATEARLVNRFDTLYSFLFYPQGFALAFYTRSPLAFCWYRKPHFGASAVSFTSSPELHLVARRPAMLPPFSPLALGAKVWMASPAQPSHAVGLRLFSLRLWLVWLSSHAWEDLCSGTLWFYLNTFKG